jgi:hypothetical protein
VEFPKVSDFNMLGDFSFEVGDQGNYGGGNGTVINVNKHNDETFTIMTKKDGLVNIAPRESQVLEHDLDELMVPMACRLLQAIEGFEEVPNLARGVGSMKTGGLFHVDVFMRGEFTIYVGFFDVNLMELEIQVGSHRKDQRELGDGSKVSK